MKQEDYKYKPIPTTFDGVRYRSRTEAAWAMLFSTDIHSHLIYEPEGISLKTGPYLVDFYDQANNCFIEIKANKEFINNSIEKFKSFVLQTGKELIVVPGRPPTPFQFSVSAESDNIGLSDWLEDDTDYSSLQFSPYNGGVVISSGILFNQCPDCGRALFVMSGDFRKCKKHSVGCFFLTPHENDFPKGFRSFEEFRDKYYEKAHSFLQELLFINMERRR